MLKWNLRNRVSVGALVLGVTAAMSVAAPGAAAQTASTTQTEDKPAATTQAKPAATAQQGAAATTTDKVTITGSFIAGTPEDAAIPVQVVTLEEMENQGSPTGLDLVKTMTAVSGVVAGETNRYNSYPMNYATINLRGLGPTRTLVLLNGRRFAEQFNYGGTGRTVNVNQIPMNAVARVETVTDGGAVTYGADAVGGVVNYITRHDYDGLEVRGYYRGIEDTDGDYGLSALWGFNFGNGNILTSLQWDRRNVLLGRDRSFGNTEFLANPQTPGWSPGSNPGSFTVATGFTTNVGNTAAAPGDVYTGDYQMGANGTFRDPACAQLGGFAGWSASVAATCYFGLDRSFDRLAEDTNTLNLYTEVNTDFSDSLRFHGEFGLYNSFVAASAHPSDINIGVGLPPTWFALRVPGANPAVADMLSRLRNSNGTNALTPAQITAATGPTGGITLSGWRPFAQGGNPLTGPDSYHRINQTQGFGAGELSGDLPEFYGFDLDWTGAVSYSHSFYAARTVDMRTDRLVNAINGLGGPNCRTSATVPTLVAGKNGCEWFNPFSSAVSGNYYTGVANTTTYNPALTNSDELVKWLYTPIWNDRTFDQFNLDFVLKGSTPITLPGGDVQVAVGGQYRYNRTDDRLDSFSNAAISPTPCQLPADANPAGTPQALTGCVPAFNVGNLWFGRQYTVLGPGLEVTRRFPVSAWFYEVDLPVLDNLDIKTSGRWETFYADLSPIDAETFVPQISARWQVNDWLALRGVAGKSFTYVSPPADDGPTNGVSAATVVGLNGSYGFGANTEARFNTANFDNIGLEPEEGENFNIGALFTLADGAVTARLDYYDITISNYVRTVSIPMLIDALVMPGQTPGPNNLINCSSSLLSDNNALLAGRPTFELTSACVQGTSTLANSFANATPTSAGRVNYFGGSRQFNGGDYHTAGIDFGVTWRLDDIFGGDLTLAAEGTQVLENGLKDFNYGGAVVAKGFDGVGQLNYAANKGGLGPVAEWRANFSANYRKDNHNFNLTARFASELESDVVGNFVETPLQNANIGNSAGYVTCAADTNPSYTGTLPGAGSGLYGADVATAFGTATGYCADQDYTNLLGKTVHQAFNVDFTYRVELPFDSTLAFSVFNLFGEEPEFSREKFSYNTSLGSPLGRNFKIDFRKKF